MQLALEEQAIASPEDIFKDSYVLELGCGFTFVGRQVRFSKVS